MQDQLILDSNSFLSKIDLPIAMGEDFRCPVFLSPLSCGLFGISEDEIEDYQSLDSLFVKNRFNTFFFKAAGDSMEPSIYQGQILVVDRSKTHFNGKVCAIAYEDKIICKRVFIRPNAIVLSSDNKKYRDIVVENSDAIKLWGVVVAIAGFID
jgi:DNA polymerase V